MSLPTDSALVFKFNDYTVLAPPDADLSVFKLNTLQVLSAPDTSASVFKLISYVVLDQSAGLVQGQVFG